jgi:hypothetical protein
VAACWLLMPVLNRAVLQPLARELR